MPSDAEAVVTAFFSKLGGPYADMRNAYIECLTEDAVWENSGFPSCKGRDACLEFLDGFAEATGLDALPIEVLAISSNGNTVLTERVDHFQTADGTKFATLPLMGVLEVRDGKISAWRDYFDPRPILPPG
jgi:limonene-1,2-epoxide hydrolase